MQTLLWEKKKKRTREKLAFPPHPLHLYFEFELTKRTKLFQYKSFFLVIGRSFRWNILFARTSPSRLVPPFRWLPLFEGFIPFFSYNVLSSFLEFSFRVSGGICQCCEGPHPLSPTFGFFKDHCFSKGFSFLRFIFAMFIFFDGVPTRSRFGLFF